MAIGLNDNIKSESPKHLDERLNNIQTLTDLYNIPAELRYPGMEVYVYDEGFYYMDVDGSGDLSDNNNWAPRPAELGGGAPIAPAGTIVSYFNIFLEIYQNSIIFSFNWAGGDISLLGLNDPDNFFDKSFDLFEIQPEDFLVHSNYDTDNYRMMLTVGKSNEDNSPPASVNCNSDGLWSVKSPPEDPYSNYNFSGFLITI